MAAPRVLCRLTTVEDGAPLERGEARGVAQAGAVNNADTGSGVGIGGGAHSARDGPPLLREMYDGEDARGGVGPGIRTWKRGAGEGNA